MCAELSEIARHRNHVVIRSWIVFLLAVVIHDWS